MRIPLHDAAWRLARTTPIPVDAPLDDPDRLKDWLPARVPGSIQRDLMRAGRLPDLYQLLDLDEALRWVDESDWWIQRELPGIQREQRAWIDFGGIDYFAAVTINGEELERRPGMYSRRRFEVTNALRKGPAVLGVRIWGAWALPRWPRTPTFRLKKWLAEHLQNGNLEPFSDRLRTLKAPVHFGWDFSPRLMVAGIWDDVHFHVTGAVAISDLWVRADWGLGLGMVIRLELDAEDAMDVVVRLELIDEANSMQCVEHSLWLYEGASRHTIHWPDLTLRPWTTHDRGTPHRYRLRVTLQDPHGTIMDRRVQIIGARTFGWHIENRVYYPLLNGNPIRFRGMNWVPLDLLPGDADEEIRYRRLLQAAVDAGVNAIRVWGGGGRERPVFYDLCDELGLLVWQEMPVACVFLDGLPQDESFIDLVRQETRGIIRSLRNHPSLFMWGGGNEWGPGRFKEVARAMGEIAAKEDPSRRWLPASPGPHDSHNWQVWHGKASPAAYTRESAPLLSEFGLAAPPEEETLREILPPDMVWPPGKGWRARKAEIEKLHHYVQMFTSGIEEQRGSEPQLQFLQPNSLQGFVKVSQEVQARALQQGIEFYRLRKDAVGTFLWQWNEPWPGITWSLLPYHGPAKRAYFQIAQSYAPIAPIAQFREDRIELWLVNDTPTACTDCLLEVQFRGRQLWQGRVGAAAHERVMVQTLPMPQRSGKLVLHLTGQDVDTTNDYLLPWPFPPAQRFNLRTWVASQVLRWLLRW